MERGTGLLRCFRWRRYLIVISVVGWCSRARQARGEIFEQLGADGRRGARAIQLMLEALNKPRQEGIVATVIGGALHLVGATTVFDELQDAFDRIWRAPARRTSTLDCSTSCACGCCLSA